MIKNKKIKIKGVPIGVKDEVDVAGYRTYCGTTFLGKDANDTQDARVVARLRAAGALIVGKV